MRPEGEKSSPPVSVGDVVDGKYRVDRVLGQGAMGVVVAATHLQLEQPVAIKFLVSDHEGVPFERFLREARATARLKGEHVCRVLDVTAREGAAPYIVMEYLAGQDLEQLVRDRGTLAITEAVDHVLQACEGLAEAHAAGIVHRDLKPANLFLATAPDGSPTIKVVDFGLVKELDSTGELAARPALTEVGGMLGSPLYMSPEQIASPKDVDTRTDIWALGVVLYELLTGRLAFPAATLSELVVLIGHRPPKAPSQLRPELAGAVEAIILRCLEKSREARFPTVAHLAAELAVVASEAVRPCAGRAARLLGIAERIEPTTGLLGASPAVVAGAAAGTPAEPDEPDVGSTIPLHDDDPVPLQTVETTPAFAAGSTLPMDGPPTGLPIGAPTPPVEPAPRLDRSPSEAHALGETVAAPGPSAIRWLAPLGLLLVVAVAATVWWLRSSSDDEDESAPQPPVAAPAQPCDHPESTRIALHGAEPTGCRAYLRNRRVCLRCEAAQWGTVEEVRFPERPEDSHVGITQHAALLDLPIEPGAELRVELLWKEVARWAVLRLPSGSGRPDHIGVIEPVLVPIFYAPNRGEGQPDCGTTEPLLLVDGCERRRELGWLREQLVGLRASGAPGLAKLPADLTLRPALNPERQPCVEVLAPGHPDPTHHLMFPPQMLEIVAIQTGKSLALHLDVEEHWWIEQRGSDDRIRWTAVPLPR